MLLRLQASPHTINILDALIGAVFCAMLAALSVVLMPRNAHRAALPIIFIVVIAMIAKRYGGWAGTLGSVSSALIFAYFWFSPRGSFAVSHDAARSDLSWMLILGITASYFLSFPEPRTNAPRISEDRVPASDHRAA